MWNSITIFYVKFSCGLYLSIFVYLRKTIHITRCCHQTRRLRPREAACYRPSMFGIFKNSSAMATQKVHVHASKGEWEGDVIDGEGHGTGRRAKKNGKEERRKGFCNFSPLAVLIDGLFLISKQITLDAMKTIFYRKRQGWTWLNRCDMTVRHVEYKKI